MVKIEILNEKRRNISEGSCPVDLMGEIQNEAKEPNAYKLTAKALFAMFIFPVEKKVVFRHDEKNAEIMHVIVEWLPSKETMTLCSVDDGKTFMVESAETKEIITLLENGKAYNLYNIDVE